MASFLSMMVFQRSFFEGFQLLIIVFQGELSDYHYIILLHVLYIYFFYPLRGIPCSFEVQTVIEKLLELDSRKRMTVSALIQELECIMSQWSVALSYANPSSAQVFIQCC